MMMDDPEIVLVEPRSIWVSLLDVADNAGQFLSHMWDARAEVPKGLETLHAREFGRSLAKHPEQSFKPWGRVWTKYCIAEPPMHGTLKRLWQGPCEVSEHISLGTYRVNIRGREEIFISPRSKPYL